MRFAEGRRPRRPSDMMLYARVMQALMGTTGGHTLFRRSRRTTELEPVLRYLPGPPMIAGVKIFEEGCPECLVTCGSRVGVVDPHGVGRRRVGCCGRTFPLRGRRRADVGADRVPTLCHGEVVRVCQGPSACSVLYQRKSVGRTPRVARLPKGDGNRALLQVRKCDRSTVVVAGVRAGRVLVTPGLRAERHRLGAATSRVGADGQRFAVEPAWEVSRALLGQRRDSAGDQPDDHIRE